MPGRLAGKRCLIVGGTSGIGLAAAERFLEEDARLVSAGLATDKVSFGSTPFVACDATVPAQVESLFHFTVEQLQGLDVLYHVAGGSGRRAGDGPLHECTDEGWQATLDANLKTTFLTNRRAIQQFLSQGQGGVILNMASVLALSPAPRFFDACAYTAAKGGVIALSRLAAARYASDRIRVNVLSPGLIDTPASARAVQDPVIMQFLQSKQPLAGGPGRPQDCSDAAVFLCSDEARLITGAVLPVDAGWQVCDAPFPSTPA
jgi:NAD(P)-dependent dehydrogenase (short-subunit alcohol dehydrogenase family)